MPPRALPTQSQAPTPPPFPLLAAYFSLLGVSVLAGSGALVNVAPALARGDFLAPHVLAAVHLFTLGVLTTAIFGVLHQFYPMALGASARSVRVAVAGFALHATGVLAIVSGFWFWHPALLATGWTLIFGAVGAIGWNLLPGRRRSPQARPIGAFVSAGHAAFGFAMLLAAARIGEFLGWWTFDRLGTIAAHYHLAALGFGTLTIIGVGSRMVPMFLVSHGPPAPPSRPVGLLLLAGLALFMVGEPLRVVIVSWTGASFMFAGVLGYLAIAHGYFRRRLRRRLDPGLRFVRVAHCNLGLAALAGVALLLWPGFQPRLWVAYGALGILGWLVMLILGMLQKLMPHLAGLRLFGRHPGGRPIPDLNQLINRTSSLIALTAAEAGLLLFATGVAAGKSVVAQVASWLWLAGVVLTVAQFVRIPLMARGWWPLPKSPTMELPA